MTQLVRTPFALTLLFACALAAKADPTYDAATKTAIQHTISQQLDAFAHEDAKAAEELAAPGIKSKFPEPTQFFDMVKKNYAALIRPKSTEFGELSDSPHGPVQTITVVAADGTIWTALYALERVDGNWRIIGCGLKKIEDQQAI